MLYKVTRKGMELECFLVAKRVLEHWEWILNKILNLQNLKFAQKIWQWLNKTRSKDLKCNKLNWSFDTRFISGFKFFCVIFWVFKRHFVLLTHSNQIFKIQFWFRNKIPPKYRQNFINMQLRYLKKSILLNDLIILQFKSLNLDNLC